MIGWIRWIALPFAVIVTFLLFALASGLAADALKVWPEPVVGFVAALAVVVVGFIVAPEYKHSGAVSVFLVGAVIAWRLVEPSFYPESYGEKAYHYTHLPIISTYIGGVVGLGLCWMFSSKKKENA